MISHLYGIYDRVAEQYWLPMTMFNEVDVQRSFKYLFNTASVAVSQYPDDYDVFYFGTFDKTTGLFDLLPSPRFFANGSQFVNRAER